MKKVLLSILPLLLAGAGCSKHDSNAAPTPESELTLERSDWTPGAADNLSTTVSFTANVDWELAVIYEGQETGWLTVTPQRGRSGKQTLQLTATENNGTTPRKAAVEVTCGARKQRLTVTQSGSGNPTEPSSVLDPEFARVLEARKYIPDAKHIREEDLAEITTLDLSGSESEPGTLTSLRGIGLFKSLESLNCSYNRLEELDLSGLEALDVLHCENNLLTTLKLDGCSALEFIYGRDNRLSALDLSSCTELIQLNGDNNRLSALDVSHNPLMIELTCDNNRLQALDLSRNPILSKLSCKDNPGDGAAVFPVTVSAEEGLRLEELQIAATSWSHDGKTITVDVRKAE